MIAPESVQAELLGANTAVLDATVRSFVSLPAGFQSCAALSQKLPEDRTMAMRFVLAVATDGEIRLMGQRSQ
jgi:hypothetical protein